MNVPLPDQNPLQVAYTAEDFKNLGHFPMEPSRQTTTRRMLMVQPDAFEARQSDAPDNAFVNEGVVDRQLALDQHKRAADLVRSRLESVLIFRGRSHDDIFPNNVFGTVNPSNTDQKQLIVGTMRNEVRKCEGDRDDIRERFLQEGYEITETAEWTLDPAELTGVLVIDHLRNIGWCGLSDRVTEASAQVLQKLFKLYAVFAFPIGIYHANVGLSILAGRVCVICPEMFSRPGDAEFIQSMYDQKIVLSEAQMKNFAGNVLALTPEDMIMSSRAFESLNTGQLNDLNRFGFQIHHTDLSQPEMSGGSMRCMLAEIQ